MKVLKKNIDDTKTYTFDALMKWKEDDRSQGFYDAFYSIRKDVTTLPLLLYNKDNVVKNILFHLNVKDTLAIHSLLNLTIQLCRDIRQFFYPYVSSFLDYFKTKLIGCDDVTIISDIFTTISFIIKYMYQDILESIDDFMKTYIFFLCHHKSYVRAFAAESMSYLLRKMTPNDYIQFIDNIITTYIINESSSLSNNEKNVLQRGMGILLFETIKGVKGEMIVKDKHYLSLYFMKLIDDNSPNEDVWYHCLVTCNKAISIQKKNGYDTYFTTLQSILPTSTTTFKWKGKLATLLNRWLRYRVGKSIQNCEDCVEQLLQNCFTTTQPTKQHLDLIPIIAKSTRFSSSLYQTITTFIPHVETIDIHALLNISNPLYHSLMLSQLIDRNDFQTLIQQYPLHFYPKLSPSDSDLVIQMPDKFPSSLIDKLLSNVTNMPITDEWCSFIASVQAAKQLPPIITNKVIEYFNTNPISASVVMATFEHNNDDLVIAKLRNLQSSQELLALAYYCQHKKLNITFNQSERSKLLHYMYSPYISQRSAATSLLQKKDNVRALEIMRILNNVELSVEMIRAFIHRLTFLKSRIRIEDAETREMMVAFSLGILQLRLSKIWKFAQELAVECISEDNLLLQHVIDFIDSTKTNVQQRSVEVFMEDSLNTTDSTTLNGYVWGIMNECSFAFRHEQFKNWLMQKIIKEYNDVDPAGMNKENLEQLNYHVKLLRKMNVPNDVQEIILRFIVSTNVNVQSTIFQIIAGSDNELKEYQTPITNIIQNLHNPRTLKTLLNESNIQEKALVMLFDKQTKSIIIDYVGCIERTASEEFVKEILSTFYDFVVSKRRFSRGELNYVLQTVRLLNSSMGSQFVVDNKLGLILLEILKKDSTATWDVMRIIRGYSQSASDSDVDPQTIFDFNNIYQIIVDRKIDKLNVFVGETLLLLPNASLYLHSIPKLCSIFTQYHDVTTQNVDHLLYVYNQIQDIPFTENMDILIQKNHEILINKYHSSLSIQSCTIPYHTILSQHLQYATELLIPLLQALSTTDECAVIYSNFLYSNPQNVIVETVFSQFLQNDFGQMIIPHLHNFNEFLKNITFVEDFVCQMLTYNDFTIKEISSSYLIRLYESSHSPRLLPKLFKQFVSMPIFSIANVITSILTIQNNSALSEMAQLGFFKALCNPQYDLLKSKSFIQKLNVEEHELIRSILVTIMKKSGEKKLRKEVHQILEEIFNTMEWERYETSVLTLIEAIKEQFKSLESKENYLKKQKQMNIIKRSIDNSRIGKKKSDIIRIVVDLLCKLPEEMKRLEVPQMVQLIVNELESRQYEIRELARRQLVEIIWKLGDSYYADVVDELKRGLQKGFLVHVLSHSSAYLLESITSKAYPELDIMSLNKNEKKMEEVNSDVTNKSMVEDFTSFSIQNALQTLLEIVHGDIFGPAAEQREVGKITSEYIEAKECKAFLTFYYIGLMIHKEELDEVTYFIKQQIKNMKKFEIVMQMDRLLREFEKGLKLNKFIQKSDLFDWSIDVAEAHFLYTNN
ncbi:U3 small nucleolar RNA-associated protein 20 C-terminal domain-containing protein [Entamoeba marina]